MNSVLIFKEHFIRLNVSVSNCPSAFRNFYNIPLFNSLKKFQDPPQSVVLYTMNAAQVLLNFITCVLGSLRPFYKGERSLLNVTKRPGALKIYVLSGFKVKLSQNNRCKACGMRLRIH